MNMLPLDLSCTGEPTKLCGLLQPCLEQTANSLELSGDFEKISIILDYLGGSKGPWLHFRDNHSGRGFCLEVFFSSELFGQSNGDQGNVFPKTEIWEAMIAPRQDVAFDSNHFRPEFCLQHLHHNLLLARDIARQELIPSRVPAAFAEAYQSCWEVTVDGRLESWGLPGFALPERRRHFSRLFSQAGVLMPNHWSIFQSLWEGGISGQGAVLEAVGGLPRL